MTEKLTRQGVRDLGGNRRRRKDPVAPLREYEADIGIWGVGGLVIRIEARSLGEALKHAYKLVREHPGRDVLQIRSGKQGIIWDNINGDLRR